MKSIISYCYIFGINGLCLDCLCSMFVSMFVCVNAERVKRQKSTGGEYQNVPFSYGTEESFRDGRKLEGAMESSEFNPPFPVPDNLHSHLVSAEAPF